MSKKLILGVALSLVLASGAFAGVRAQGCSLCNQNTSIQRDLDRPEAVCQGAYNYGPKAPVVMGTTGAW